MSEDRRKEVVVEFFGAEPPGLRQLEREHPASVSLLEAKGFNAMEFALEALVVLPAVGDQIASIVKAHIEAKRDVRIKSDGVELTGLSADDAVKVLRQLEGEG